MTSRKVFVEVDVGGEGLPLGDSGSLLRIEDDLTLIAGAVPKDGVPVSILTKDSRRGILATLATQWGLLPASDRANKVAELKSRGYTHRKIAEESGINEQDISFYARLNSADPRIAKALDESRVSASAVEPLLALSLDEQEELVPTAIQRKTVRGIKALVHAHELSKSVVTGNGKEEINEEIDPGAQLALDFLREADNILQSVYPGGAVWTPGTRTQYLRRIESLKNSIAILERDLPNDETE